MNKEKIHWKKEYKCDLNPATAMKMVNRLMTESRLQLIDAQTKEKITVEPYTEWELAKELNANVFKLRSIIEGKDEFLLKNTYVDLIRLYCETKFV